MSNPSSQSAVTIAEGVAGANETGDAMRVVGYVRVSTEEQHTSGVGLDAQRAAITAECERRGWTLLRIEQDVLSGSSMKRPGLQTALAACRSGEANALIVSKLDRLSRSIIDFASVLADARKCGYNVAAIDLGLDLSTPQGELVANVVASVAQWERRIIGQRTREALAVKRTEGVVLGRRPQLPHPVERQIWRARQSGKTFAAIAATLNARSVPTAHGGEQWHPSTVRSVTLRLARAKGCL